MHRFMKIIIPIISLAFFASACTQSNVENIDTKSAQSLAAKQQSVIILDVRTPEEYKLSHIDGAVNIDISNSEFSNNVSKLDHDKTYIVHCAANVKNGRTAKSLIIMDDLGFDNLLNLEGGIVAWEQDGLPLVKNAN